MALYAVTDPGLNRQLGRSLRDAVADAIRGGATMVQVLPHLWVWLYPLYGSFLVRSYSTISPVHQLLGEPPGHQLMSDKGQVEAGGR